MFNQKTLPGWIAVALFLVILWIFKNHLDAFGSILWPLVVAGALLGFRSELSALLRRIRRVSRQGAEFGEGRIAAQIMSQPVEAALRSVVPDENPPPYILRRVQALRIDLNAREPEDEERREYLLMLRLAESQQGLHFQYVWLNIFWSQLEALTNLAAAGENAVDLKPYHELHVLRANEASTAENPVTSLTFEIWAGFLVLHELVALTERSGTITQQGRDFLILATQANLPRFHIL
jgi:hypothetical protein